MISKAANDWLLNGERGISSEAIFSHLTGINILGGRWFSDHPSDPSDFRRCQLLLEAVPEFKIRFPEMATRSKVWEFLVQKWDEILISLEEELPSWRLGGGSAHKTYELMKNIIRPIEENANQL
ncbi:MAG: hypothetical protein A2Y94_13805 [Caldithrix sp. RBG_13_44_9]|nr:MAG: hypothetical protein A2Y94_13805 [Caldithrix sp. RBG_13_44_9]